MAKENKYTHGFKVPADYFKEMEEEIAVRILEEEVPSELGFKTPEGYFDGLENRLVEKIQEKESNESSKVISIWSGRNISYAAAIAACLIIGWLLLIPSEITHYNQLPLSEVDDYIQNGEMDVEIYDVSQLLTEADWEELPGILEFEESNLESYLLEQLDESMLLIE